MRMSFDLLPEAICLLDEPTLSIKEANSKFCRTIADVSRFKGLSFLENFVAHEDHARFRVALNRLKESKVNFLKSSLRHFPSSIFSCAGGGGFE